MTAITIDIPDDMLEKARWFSENLSLYDGLEDYLIQGLRLMINFDLETTQNLRIPFSRELVEWPDG